MIRSPLVSVIMAVFNGEEYLREAIDSVLQQTFQDFELIIVNDGSTDRTEEIIISYDDVRIHYLKNEINLKLVGSLNRALRAARGAFIARMDSDDMMYPNRLEIQSNFLIQNEKVGVLGGDIDVIDENSKIVTSWKYPNSDIDLKKALLQKSPFCHPVVMFRRSLFKEDSIIYDSKYPNCEDYDLWIRLHRHTEFYSLNQKLLKYRRHQNQITDKKIRSVHVDVLKLIFMSVLEGKLSRKSLLYLYKPLFYVLAPKLLIDYQMRRVKLKGTD